MKGNKLSTLDKAFIIMLVLFLAVTLWANVSPVSFRQTLHLPLVTVYELVEPEATKPSECERLGGICVPIQQGCNPQYYFEYGKCQEDPPLICCLPDLCTSSGGVWTWESAEYSLNGRPTFTTVCLCPYPKKYDAVKGCVEVYQ